MYSPRRLFLPSAESGVLNPALETAVLERSLFPCSEFDCDLTEDAGNLEVIQSTARVPE
jgi:hypothetical protein